MTFICALKALVMVFLASRCVGLVFNVPKMAEKRRRMTYFSADAGRGGSPSHSPVSSGSSEVSDIYFSGDGLESGTSTKEIWEFWQRRRQSMSVLKHVLSDDRNANVTKEFNDFQAFTIVEKEHVKHLNELFMAAMGEASSEVMDFLWLDSDETMCAIEADEAVFSGYQNITDMWNDNFRIQKQQQVQLEMEQGKTYNLQIEQLDEPTLQFFGDTVMVQTNIRITCIVEELDTLGDIQKIAMNGKGGKKGKRRKNKAGSPVQLHITNVFVRPPESDRYFLSAHIASKDSTANSSKRLSKETYLDTSAKPPARKRGGATGVSLQQLLSGGIMGGDNRGISISSDDLDDSDDEEDEDMYEDEDEYVDYDEEEGDDEDDDDDGSIQLSVSASDAAKARGLVNSISDAVDGKIKVIVKDEFSDNFFGGDDEDEEEEGGDGGDMADGDEDGDGEGEIVKSGTLSSDTPSLAKIFSAEIVKGTKGGDAAAGSTNNAAAQRDAEWARERDRQELVAELGATSPKYDIGGVSGSSDAGDGAGTTGDSALSSGHAEGGDGGRGRHHP
jgi:hypothetical protein